LPTAWDLSICAKDLFIAAMDQGPSRVASGAKLAERIEVELGPFRPAASRRAECLLVALPTSWDLLLSAKDLFGAASRAAVAMGPGPLVMPKATGVGGERAWHQFLKHGLAPTI
jgi:hypothetical protein